MDKFTQALSIAEYAVWDSLLKPIETLISVGVGQWNNNYYVVDLCDRGV